ncbi:hypothetical protein HN011_006543 [Eciton burchellii]|nr:hypothetical protein HN011_006543 [Eciton burchellii]
MQRGFLCSSNSPRLDITPGDEWLFETSVRPQRHLSSLNSSVGVRRYQERNSQRVHLHACENQVREKTRKAEARENHTFAPSSRSVAADNSCIRKRAETADTHKHAGRFLP